MTNAEILSRYDEVVANFAARLVALDSDMNKRQEKECREQYELFKAGRDALRAQFTSNEPLTLDELRQMNNQPVWCSELENWGIIHIDSGGSWANKPFLLGYWEKVQFNYDVEYRKLTLYRRKPEGGER